MYSSDLVLASHVNLQLWKRRRANLLFSHRQLIDLHVAQLVMYYNTQDEKGRRHSILSTNCYSIYNKGRKLENLGFYKHTKNNVAKFPFLCS